MKRLSNGLLLGAKIVTNITGILFLTFAIGKPIAIDENYIAISRALKQPISMIVEKEEGEEEDTEYYKSEFDSVAEVKENGETQNQRVLEEGAVLLKNENDALPLEEGESINPYSVSVAKLVLAGTGSSGTNNDPGVSFLAGLKEAGFEVNEALYNWYASNFSTYGRVNLNGGNIGANFSIREAPWSALPNSAKEYADTGIFLLARTSGEGADMAINTGNKSDMTNGDYLELNPNEKSVLLGMKELKDAGKLSKIVVLVNSASPLQLDFLDEEEYGIDAAMWIGTVGSTGIRGVASLLKGEKNPSGKLPDTYFRKHYLNPIYANFGGLSTGWTYSPSISSDGKSNHYVVYQEGIYSGYRYAETRYEDFVMGTGFAGDFDYDEVIQFPFGYGLSYTEFSFSSFEVSAPKDSKDPDGVYTVSVNVTNDGFVPGKEVAQIYLQKPYTDYDKRNGVEKSAVDFVGFAKTKLLNPGETQTLTIEVSAREFASYDSNGAGTYILEKGDYYLSLGRGSHDATDNILKAKGFNTHGDHSLTYKRTVTEDDFATYSKSKNGTDITNRFDNADINRYEGRGDNEIAYMSRSDWEETCKLGLNPDMSRVPGSTVVLSGTDQMRQEVAKAYVNAEEEDPEAEYPTYGAEAKYSIADMHLDEIAYDDPRWDELLDQLDFDQTRDLLNSGLRCTKEVVSLNKPETKDHNGATGPVQTYGDGGSANRGLAVRNQDPNRGQYPTIYPGSGIVAATFSKDLSFDYGLAWGEDCLWAGYSGLYGPGLNAHRGAFAGRYFEYFSEDPLLSGQVCSRLCDGLKDRGVYAYLKHFALNDQEGFREGVCTWANEQSIRELYLKPYQIVVENRSAECVMTGFNRLGVLWTGNQGFLNTVFHGEWGSRGIAVSDWWTGSYMNHVGGIYNGNDIPDGTNVMTNSEWDVYRENHPAFAWAMRESAHRILYTVAHSNAMNGLSSNTKVVSLTPAWVGWLNSAKLGVDIAFYASLGLLGVAIVLKVVALRKKP